MRTGSEQNKVVSDVRNHHRYVVEDKTAADDVRKLFFYCLKLSYGKKYKIIWVLHYLLMKMEILHLVFRVKSDIIGKLIQNRQFLMIN